MKSFLKKVAIYSVLIFLSGNALIYICLLLIPQRSLGNITEYEIWKYQKEATLKYKGQTKNIIIGDSKGLADLDPNLLKHNFIDFSLGGATLFEGYSAIKNFLKYNKIDTLVLCYGTTHYMESDVLEARTLPYRFCSSADLQDMENLENRYGITIDYKQPGTYLNLNRKLIYEHEPTKFRDFFIDNIQQEPLRASVIQDLNTHSGHCMFGNADSSNEKSAEINIFSKLGSFKANPVIMAYLDSVYYLAKQKGIKIYIVIPPINQRSCDVLRKMNYDQHYTQFIQSVAHRYPEINIFSSLISLPDTLFGDPNHLNHKGVNIFTRSFKSVLEK